MLINFLFMLIAIMAKNPDLIVYVDGVNQYRTV